MRKMSPRQLATLAAGVQGLRAGMAGTYDNVKLISTVAAKREILDREIGAVKPMRGPELEVVKRLLGICLGRPIVIRYRAGRPYRTS
jgi:hypothetical protein